MKKPGFPPIPPKIRRLLIFLITVVIGTLLIFYDLPTAYLLGGTLVAGCIVLIVFGAVKISDLRPKNIRKGLKNWIEEKKQRSIKEESLKKTSLKEESDGRSREKTESKNGMIRAGLASLSSVFRGSAGRLKASLFHKEDQFREIDTILDAEMDGGAVVEDEPDTTATVSTEAADSLLDISDEDLESLTLDGEELDLSGQSVDMSPDAEIPAVSADDSIVSEIFRANAAELEEFSELGEIGELDEALEGIDGVELDEIDLDSLDLSDEDLAEITPETGSKNDLPEAVQSQDALALPELPEEEEETPKEDNLIEFASGGGSDSLLSLLKKDVKKRKKGEYNSLLRGMKGMKINAEDLVSELEDTLKALDGESAVKKNG
ncbi:MAG: hypothetical protein PWP08_284 [Methanofollis sp.]|nr:hypothetical protein [Methanofollis sp.]